MSLVVQPPKIAFSNDPDVLADHSVLTHTFNNVTFHVANAAMIDAKVTDKKAMPKSFEVFKGGDTDKAILDNLEKQGEAVTAAIIDAAHEMLPALPKPVIQNKDYTTQVSDFAKKLLTHLMDKTSKDDLNAYVDKMATVITPLLINIYIEPKYITPEKKKEVTDIILKKTKQGKEKHYYLFSALGEFFESNQPTGGFRLPVGDGDNKIYMEPTRYDLFSNKCCCKNNVLVLSEAFVKGKTNSLIPIPDESPFMTDKYVTQDTKEDKHGVLVHNDMQEPTIIDRTNTFHGTFAPKFTVGNIGDFTLVTVNDINVLNWHSISDGITYEDFKTLLNYVLNYVTKNIAKIDLMMGDSNITEDKQIKRLKEDLDKFANYDSEKSMIGKFIKRYNSEVFPEKPKLMFKAPQNKIRKIRYLGNIILNNQLHKADDEDYDGMFIIDFANVYKDERLAIKQEIKDHVGGGRRRTRRGRGKRVVRRTRKGNRIKKVNGKVRSSRRGRGRVRSSRRGRGRRLRSRRR